MLKKSLRKTYTKRRNSLSQAKRTSDSIAIANKLLELPLWDLDYYHLFLPITKKNEIDTTTLLSVLQGKDKHVIVPKVVNAQELQHFLLTDNTTFVLSKWGVPEPMDGVPISPEKLDVVFVPLLAFDDDGNRVGYGKGYYDTFLSTCRKDVIKVGLSFFEAEEKITDINVQDIPLDYCVTPVSIYSFGAS